jgi:autotransporter-associated beta strand protein
LQLQGAVAIGVEALTLNGSGVSNDGALRNVSGNNSWAGAVTLGSAATIASDADTLSLNGAIDNNGHALTVAGAGNTTVGAAISGTGGLTKEGAGTLTLNAASSFAGNITIIEGTLLLGASDRIGDSTNMDLNGGTFATGGYDETLGTLTLSANSYIDLGDADSVLSFANSSAISWTPDTVLIVRNWNGSGYGGGSDQLYFGNALTGLTAGQLAQIRFENPNGVSGLFVAGILPTGEVVPIPEPWPAAIVALLAAIVAWKERRQIARFWMTCTSSIAQVRGAMK